MRDIDKETGTNITEHHKAVSNIDTPSYFVKSKGGIDYVEYSYMRELADKYYPGWDWVIIKGEPHNDAYVVHGRLRWFDKYLNIADDVYRNRIVDLSLTDEDKETIRNSMEGLDSEWVSKIEGSMERGEIEKPDMDRIIERIKSIKEEGENNE